MQLYSDIWLYRGTLYQSMSPFSRLVSLIKRHICLTAAAENPHAFYSRAVHLDPSHTPYPSPAHLPHSMHALFSAYLPTPNTFQKQ